MPKDVAFPVQIISGEADGGVTLNRFVKQSGLGTDLPLFAMLAAQGQRVDGVSIRTAATGDTFAVGNKGIFIVEAAGAFTAGDWVVSSANGRVMAHSPGETTAGKAMSTSGGAGELVGIWLETHIDSIT